MKNKIKKIRDDVVKIISEAKPVFFVGRGEKVKISAEDLQYETRAEICMQVEMYFIKLLDE